MKVNKKVKIEGCAITSLVSDQRRKMILFYLRRPALPGVSSIKHPTESLINLGLDPNSRISERIKQKNNPTANICQHLHSALYDVTPGVN